MHLFLANWSGLLTGRLSDDRCGTSHELPWQITQSQPCGSVPQPLLFLGPVSQKGPRGRGKLRKRETMPLALLDIPLLFGALALRSTRFTLKDRPSPGPGGPSLRVWAVAVMLGSTAGRLENILPWANQMSSRTNTHTHTHMYANMHVMGFKNTSFRLLVWCIGT